MEPTATFGFIASRAPGATGMDSPLTEIQDFDRVMEVYWPRVLRFVMASVRDRDIAETLTQDCFWNAYRSRKRFRGDCSVNTWLMRIAVNAVRKCYRNRRIQFWRQLQQSAIDTSALNEVIRDQGISPEANALVCEQVRAVWQATKNLSGRQRSVFLLRFMEDMTVVEIADITGMTVSSVNVHLFRAVRSVRKSMGRAE
jgi:RNA polymerase sigma-70 factor, ECF subfamily